MGPSRRMNATKILPIIEGILFLVLFTLVVIHKDFLGHPPTLSSTKNPEKGVSGQKIHSLSMMPCVETGIS